MTVTELLTQLHAKHVTLEVADDELIVVGDETVLDDPALLTQLRSNKAALMALVSSGRYSDGRLPVPPNLIPPGCGRITPELLPLVALSAEDIDDIVATVPGGAANVQDIYPLVPLQEGLLFHHLLQSEGDAYLTRVAAAFDSRARLDTFLSALQAVIDRHDILRTAFVWEGLPQPVQVVWREAALPVHELALDAGQPAAAQLLDRTDPRHLRINLHQAPLLAAYVAQDAATGEWLLSLLNHHLVSDHVTQELIFGEIQCLLRGEAGRLPPPLSYRDFVVQARAVPAAEHEAYFRAALAGITEPTAPFGVLDVQGKGDGERSARLLLDAGLAQRIRHAARQQGVPASVLFHAAWGLVVAHCSSRSGNAPDAGNAADVVFGTVLLGRLDAAEGADRALGMFMNTLPLRVTLAGRSVAQVIADTHRRLVELMAHEHASLALAQRCSGVEAPLPLFTALLNYRHGQDAATAVESPEADAWTGMRRLTGEAYSNYPVGISVDDYGPGAGRTLPSTDPKSDRLPGFALTAQCAPGVDPARLNAYLATALASLVRALAEAPDQPALDLDLLPEAERRLLLDDWNATTAPVDPPFFHLAFEAQAVRQPEAVALVFEDQTLRYGELNTLANQLAHHLIGLGVRPDDRVAICLERGPALVTAVLAVQKSGAAYVPLDPHYPKGRLAWMLNDSAPVALLTESAVADRLPASGLLRLVVLDDARDRADIARQPARAPDPAALGLRPEHLAYVIYTSGSTGQPKGVMVPHRGLANLAPALARLYGVNTDSRVLQFVSFSFDVCISEITMALASGAQLILARAADLQPGEPLWTTVLGQHITHLSLPASVLATLARDLGAGRTWGGEGEKVGERGDFLPDLRRVVGLRNENPAKKRPLRPVSQPAEPKSDRLPAFPPGLTLIMGGEPCNPVLAHHWAGRCRLFNAYGPTEATVCATSHYCTGAETGVPPIGRPLANVRAYVLDARGRPAPIGVAGELYVGGVGVARGYLNQPALTAARFVADPFAADPQSRLYGTGDLARWREDGNLEFLGRNDTQLKIRGFRIEPGEIEAQLAACAGVREAVVVARGDGAGARLVAYVVAEEGTEEGAEPSPAALREQLAAVLPEHLVPASYVLLPALPLTPSGKLDRRALPAPDSGAHLQQAYAAPEGEVETTLAGLWETLLGVRQIGRHDHFFELGGHSLVAVQLIARLHRVFGAEVALRELFAHPTLAEFAVVVGRALPPTAAGPEAAGPIPPADRSQPLPLSWAQQRLWFLDQLDPAAGAVYQVPTALRLHGNLDLPALQAALDHLVARHEVLRTCFQPGPDGGEPVQVIASPDSGFALEVQDLRSLDLTEQDAAVGRLRDAELRRPFDLSRGPLIRALLLQLADDDHLLLVAQHHIISDGWSIGVLVREVMALYTAASRGEPAQLPPLPLQYADYAAWQRQWLQGARLAEQVDFWRRHLAGAPALLPLPTDRPRPAVQCFDGAALPVVLPPALTAGLKALSRRHGTTPFMTLLAGWALLLARISGQPEVVIGTPVADRPRPELEPLIGFFINTLALRIDAGGGQTMARLLGQVKATTLAAYAHQDLPFEQVVEALQPVRSMSHSPIFQVRLTWNTTPAEAALELPGLRLAPVPLPHTRTPLDLSLSLADAGEVITGGFEYATALFERATIERLGGHFQTLLAAMVDATGQPIAELPLLNAAERQQLLVDWNTPPPAAEPATLLPQPLLPHLLAAQAAARPDAPALACGGEALSYAELNTRANRLAHLLLAQGVRPDDRVALCTERGFDQVIAALAVLKSGAAFVPLDPAYPEERLGFMLADCAPVALLTQVALEDRLPALSLLRMLLLDDPDFQAELAAQPATDPVSELRPDHLAYVIYTSGSTGQPKGVLNHHRGLANLAAAQSAAFGVTADSRVLQFASFSFDASVSEIAMALASGGCLQLASRDDLQPGEPLQATLVRQAITHVTLPPSVLATLDPETLPPLTVITAGEACPGDLARRWAARHTVFNAYGPTETTVCATLHRCRADEDGPPPIGRPLSGQRVYLLDAHQQPVPVGVVGELHVGGVGVARGYWNRPELTAERFIRDPFSSEPAARLYKTGDLARWRPDGTLDFLGRNDFQVKLRGIRIELGEIEAQLRGCSGVAEAVVLAREDRPGAPRLVAYLVPDEGADIDVGGLRGQLAAVLPDYLVPAAYVALPAFPLTPNGKIDRPALPAPESGAYPQQRYEPPQGAVETALAGLWQQLLGVAEIGRQDHFFALGGHSLLAVQLVARVRQEMAVELALRDVFAAPVLADQAALIAAAAPATLDSIPPADRSQPLPLSWAQLRLWFLDQLDPAAGAAYQMPVGLRLRGPLDAAALQAALDRLVARHEGLRTRFEPVPDSEPVQVIAPPDCGFALETRDLRELPEAEREARVSRLGEEEAARPFDLARGPLIRGQLVTLAEQDYVLFFNQHHIVTDGWSNGLLVNEVIALYTAFSQGQPDPLPPLPIQYADYAVWQRQWLQGEALAEQLGFWRSHLAGAPALLPLPTDTPRPPVHDYAGASLPFTLPAPLAAGLRDLSRRHGTTLFMTLLAGWATLLARLSGQSEVVVGTPVANRPRAELEPLIGFFVNTLALRIPVDRDTSVAALLQQVKSLTLDAYRHQDVPFEQVVDALQPVRSLSHSPLFQVMLILDNTPAGPAARLPGLELAPLPLPHASTPFDLSLALTDTGDAITGSLHYATALWQPATIERFAGHFRTLLEAMAGTGDPQAACWTWGREGENVLKRGQFRADLRHVAGLHNEGSRENDPLPAHLQPAHRKSDRLLVHQLPLLSAAERRQLLVEWNDTATPAPMPELAHQRFEAHASRQPDAPALVFEDRTLSYGELNRRANRLAHHLRTLGAVPDDRVAICLDRRPELVVAVLAVLKAGGAYVPLDPAYPAERLAFMLADSAPVAIVTQADLLDRLPALAVPMLVMDDAATASMLDQAPDANPDPAGLTADHLAYVIYTSGSTGQPKGVMNHHRGLCNLAQAQRGLFGAGPGSHVLQWASFSFDASVWETVMALGSGACLHLAARDAVQPGEPLLATLRRHGISHLTVPPSALALLDPDLLPPMTVIVAGEACPAELARRWAGRHHFWNAYGPTETTVCATVCRCRPDETTPPPIGRPIANLQAYVLDEHRQPVPVGAVGELYVGGAGVARGYLNRPELSAERFVDDPFSDRPGTLYKTGDLVRWRPDGTLEYVGRNDFQVKLRGFRIELGEIEARLLACAGVREAVVVAREDVAGEPRLVAYLVPEAGTAPAAGELREQLAAHLADYLLPAAYVLLERFPTTPNGKLDRQALPAPEAGAYAQQQFAAPIGPVETALAAIWQDLLRIEQVGRHDHFFALGGHSLLAVRLTSRLRQAFGVELALREVFAHPVLADLAAQLAAGAAAAADPIPAADRSAPLPLSWAQQRLWFLDQLDPAASVAYHLPLALRLRGTLDRTALQAALDRLVARHEILRTTFAKPAGQAEPIQVIAPPGRGFDLGRHDLRPLPPDQQQAAAERLSAAESTRRFDLAAGPLIRGQLLTLADDEHLLLFNQHHIVTDGWSLGLLVNEVVALYTAFARGAAEPLPAPAIQYADYAVWQRERLQGAALQEQLDYWRRQLADAPALLALPTDHPRPPTPSHAGASVPFVLPPERAAAVRQLGQRHGTTLFMTMLAAWSLLLARLGGQPDVVVGSSVANRHRTELESLIGLFVNLLALRVTVDDTRSVGELLAQVKALTLDAYAHQEVPFEQVVDALQPERSLSHSPIFQAMLVVDNTPRRGQQRSLTLPGLKVAPVELPNETCQFDLSLAITDTGDTISGSLAYASDLFERATIERMVGYLQTLLAGMAADDHCALHALPLLSAAERRRLLVEWNDTARPYPRDALIQQVFEQQAAARPDAVALECAGATMTYGELNTRANRLAHQLRGFGLRPDDRVAVCLERGLDLAVSWLAVLKAGGAYLPLEPDAPEERLLLMLDDAAPVVLLTRSDLADRLPALSLLRLVVLDDPAEQAALATQPDSNPDPAGLTATHLAYVIYTSGSTGRPKGVMVEHRSVLRLVLNNGYAAVEPGDCLSQTANPAFDASTWEVWGALLNGARLLVIPQPVLLDPPALNHTLVAGGVTHLWITIGLFNQYADALAEAMDRCRYVLFGGDIPDPRIIARVVNAHPSTHVLHCYGPTETTTYATTHDLPAPADPALVPPIGRPIGNTTLYLLDRHLQPVPVGAVGEICLGGDGVARGYLNRPELTAERFIDDPFQPAPGARLYRTGDLARLRPDGNVDFIGRNDQQVKIRGFRVEPGEIEARLVACRGVREALVVPQPNPQGASGDKRLVAYLLAEEGAELDVAEVRSQLASVLADYMVPAAFVVLDTFPLNANGKLDRRALPAPDADAFPQRGYEPPQGEIELAIAAIWKALLGLERVGRHDHFFECGGHSLLAVTFIERLRQAGYPADIRALFATPTLAAIAAGIARRRESPPAAEVPPNRIPADRRWVQAITPDMLPLVQLSQAEIDAVVATVPGGAANVQDLYPLAPLQEGILFHHLLGSSEHESTGDAYLLRTTLAFDHRGRLDGFLAALQTVIDRHDILRTAIVWDGLPQALQVVWRDAPLPVIEHELDPETDAAEQLLDLTDPRRTRLDLRQAPLLAAHVGYDAANGEWLLALLKHHLVCDHVSFELALEEIRLLLQGRADQLPPPLPYRNFIAQARAVSPAEHAAYFREQLGDVTETTAPFGLLDVQHDGAAVADARVFLDPARSGRIREQARRLGVTAAVLFHVAWAQVLARCSGRTDVVFGTVLLGRWQAEGVERVLGMFINTLPLRVSLEGRTVREVVADTHQRLTGLMVHEQASLVQAQRCSGVAPPQPLFTAIFNYRHSDAGARADAATQQAWEGIRSLAGEERTNYPIGLAVDDLGDGRGDGFVLTAQCLHGVSPERLAAYVKTAVESLAEALANESDQPVSALPILPAEELQLLQDWNHTDAPAPADPLIQRFEAQAAARPEAVALVFQDQTLSYAELNRRANQVAHRLLALGRPGVRPDDRVAICAGRGFDMICGLLGILKAGGAYVPLDPAYPAERLAFMLADCAPVAVLVQTALQAPLPDLPMPLLTLGGEDFAGQPVHNPEVPDLTPDHLAYVIYTSGSTGRPKGVMVTHRSLANLTEALIGAYGMTPESRMLQFVSFSFDVCISEIAMALGSGAQLVLAPAEDLQPGEPLARALQRHAITHVNLPASALAALPQDTGYPAGLTVVVGGEPCAPSVARHWASRSRLFNAYGPTEATVCATTWACPPDLDGIPPIGRPIANVRTYVLDADRRPVPIGVPGELYIGGAGVARGYLNQPALTAERFLSDPFAEGKLYRTGDLVRWREDGTLDFLGRNDTQVKIRGFRIELGEIEARLRTCPGVRDAAVLAREDASGNRRLVAYVVPAEDAMPAAETLRAALAAVLAEPMVPAAYVVLDALPLTPNGKLDRQALPAPDGEAYPQSAYEPPQGPTETALADLWQQLLDVPQVGRGDHFFRLGGHSLLAVQLTARVRQQLGVDLPLREVFAHPRLQDLARVIGDAARPPLPPIPVADRSRPLPLSWAQQRLWFLARLDPAAGAAYQIPGAVRLRGALDTLALEAALDCIVARHEILRTTFLKPADGSEPVQRIAPAGVGFGLVRHDFRALDGSWQEAAVDHLARKEARQPFDLAQGPLLRGRLLSLADDEHLLFFNLHHIIADAASIDVLVREFAILYAAFSRGEGDPLPPLAIQYADYAAWQRQRLHGDALRDQLDFWRNQLAGAPALLPLPTDHPRPAVQRYDGGVVPLQLPAELTAALKGLAQRHGTTLFMTLLAAWATLLARLAGQADVVVGTPVANRPRAELEPLIGFFVNTLALRVDVGGDQTVAGLLAQVKARTLDAYAHQDVPFEQVVEALQPPRSLSYSPLFQVMLTLTQAGTGAAPVLPGLEAEPLALPQTTAQWDLSLALTDGGETLAGSLQYATALFEPATVERFAGHFRTLLAAMAADDSRRLAELPLLGAAERHQLLHDWNNTAAAFAGPPWLHRRFEQQAATRPDAVALVFAAQTLSYGELNARANRVAHRLLALGVRPDDRVAICVERGFSMVEALLGVLKAGGAYVPLDPAYPAERLAFMLADCAPVAVLTQPGLAARLPESPAPQLRLGGADFAGLPDHNPELPALTPQHLAYVIYTSGSTGRPKGVMVPHAALANLAQALPPAYGVTDASRVLQFVSFSFDVCISEVALALASGAQLVLAPAEALQPGEPLARTMRRHAVTHVNLPASALAALPPDADFSGALTLIVGGEPCAPAVARHWASRCRLFNAYGPTEATVCATTRACPADVDGVPPIGRPIANVRVYVLDGERQPVPIGVAGEVYVGGAGVACGYLNQPALTAERFLSDPFTGGKVYRTGDLARWRPDGTLEFLGRSDDQVKLRGFRIELGEIEAQLAACAGVRDAAVVLHDPPSGDRRLVGYVVPAEGATPDAATLRSQLARQLPDYMLPAAFVVLDAFPVTPSGKLDRRALPAPEGAAHARRAYEAPVGPLETAIAGLWQELLGIGQIGRHDHFFELGGHSLLVVSFIDRLRQLGWTADVRMVFTAPVLAALAALISNAKPAPAAVVPPNLIPARPKPQDIGGEPREKVVL